MGHATWQSCGCACWRKAVGLLAVLVLTACAGPSERFDDRARDLGFARDIVEGDGFSHAVFGRPGEPGAGPLHIYLGSDGTPWRRGRWPAEDPTPREPLALELMALDPSPSIYLGRPCYHGLTAQVGCNSALWTDRRYSDEVVTSMAAAVRRLAGPERHVVLIGYSGGGTLAMLLASRLATTDAVVTVAANLDIIAWAEHHDYQPLTGSLNPTNQRPLAPAVTQLHLAGGSDRRVPPKLIEAALAKLGSPPLLIMSDHGHGSGWQRSWPRLLATLRQRLAALESARY